MEAINNERIYQNTKKFIQDNINLDIFSDISRNKLVSLYSILTPNNAENIYNEVYQLYNEAVFNMKRELSCILWKCSASSFLLCGIVCGVSHVGLKYHKNDYLEQVNVLSAIGLGLSVIVFFSAGFA